MELDATGLSNALLCIKVQSLRLQWPRILKFCLTKATISCVLIIVLNTLHDLIQSSQHTKELLLSSSIYRLGNRYRTGYLIYPREKQDSILDNLMPQLPLLGGPLTNLGLSWRGKEKFYKSLFLQSRVPQRTQFWEDFYPFPLLVPWTCYWEMWPADGSNTTSLNSAMFRYSEKAL